MVAHDAVHNREAETHTARYVPAAVFTEIDAYLRAGGHLVVLPESRSIAARYPGKT